MNPLTVLLLRDVLTVAVWLLLGVSTGVVADWLRREFGPNSTERCEP